MTTKLIILFLIVLMIIPSVTAISRDCTRVIDPPTIFQTTTLCADNYYPYDYPQGLIITEDNIDLDCSTSVLQGKFKSTGIVITDRENITIKNCQIANYDVGILIKNSKNIFILNANMFHNFIGIKIIDSTQVIVENSFDISIKKPLQLINTRNNVFHYVNKNLQGETCRLNQCNEPRGIVAREHELAKIDAPNKFLRRILNDAIRAWIFA